MRRRVTVAIDPDAHFWNGMKGMRLLPIALLVVACTGRRPAASTDADFSRSLSQQGVDAVLWQATSAEARRLYQQCFELARIRLDQNLQDPGPMPPAVIVDVDETMLDNTPYEIRNIARGTVYDSASWTTWVNEASARALPGAVDFLKYAESRGCEIFYVTNRERHHRAGHRGQPPKGGTSRWLTMRTSSLPPMAATRPSAGFPSGSATISVCSLAINSAISTRFSASA
jgi:hypothetical protein